MHTLQFVRTLLVLLLLGNSIRADELTNLRTTLQLLRDSADLSGTADYVLWMRTRDGSDERTEAGQIRVRWSSGAGGVNLTFAKTLLDEAEREQQARRADPDRTAPKRNAILSFNALQIAEAIDFSTTLLRELERSELISTGKESLDAETVTVLTFKLPPRLSTPDQKHVRNAEVRLRIRQGRDGIPIAAERTVRIRASFFFIRLESRRTERWQLTRRGNQLIAVRHEDEESTSGLTRSVSSRATTLLTLD